MTDEGSRAGKMSFADIYDLPDPRAFYRTLAPLDYQVPEHARGPFGFLIRLLRSRDTSERFSVLDLCCSYGVNAALLNHDLTLADLYARYRSAELEAMSSDEVIASDRDFFARHRSVDAVPMIGLDAAANAIEYGRRAGLLDVGVSEDLEADEPSEFLQRHLADVQLVTVTGGMSYITEATFDRILRVATLHRQPWIAVYSLRWVDMAPIRTVLERYGYVLETLLGRTFRQRLFASDEEREHTLARLRGLGIDPDGVETDGYHHAAFYLARPPEDVEATSLDDLLAPVL